ncbi:hypothetical protein O988_06872 [Pseudogymnoascus sp. VKM F-3808]|nr:hypothetical protein O988_06872 [Pseudogymnoascus sp. VKM F-3808]
MEDPLNTSATDAFHMLNPELPSFSYPDAYVDYQVPKFINPSYLSGTHLTTTSNTYPSDGTYSATNATTIVAPLDFPKTHDDLSHFFADSPFSSPTPNQRHAPLKPHTYSPIPWAAQERGWNNNNNNNNNQHNATTTWTQPSLAILTSGVELDDARTVVHHGYVTSSDSPKVVVSSSSLDVKGCAGSARRGSRKGKERVSAASSGGSLELAASLAAKVKKARKPRRSSKKMTTAEQAAAKRETYLKRNREAAYKCRMKKKTQTEEVMERVEALGNDNRVKSVKVEGLKREVESLRGLLLPHYRVCGNELVLAYLDGLGGVRSGGVPGGDASLKGGPGSEVGCSLTEAGYGEDGETFGAVQEMGDEDINEEEQMEEQRRRVSEQMEQMSAASRSAATFDSVIKPGMGGGGDGMHDEA